MDEERQEISEFSDLCPKGSIDSKVYFNLKRKLERPKLYFLSVFRKVVIVLCLCALLGIAIATYVPKITDKINANLMAWAVCSTFMIVVFILKGKNILIWLVRVYQKIAPEKVRQRCVFVPSCSEYMILAIEKYGVIKGVIKGIKRLKRCHLPNHGEDYP